MSSPNAEELALSIEELAECIKEIIRVLGNGELVSTSPIVKSLLDLRLEKVYKKATRAKDRIKPA